jgi:hypothetical protein
VDGGELVGGPDGEDEEEDEAGEVDGSSSAEAGDAADVDHPNVDEPHGEGEEDLGVAEIRRADGGLGDERADEEAGGHAGKSEEEGFEGDLIQDLEGGLKDGEPREGGGFLFEAALLNQVEERGEKREQEGGVGSQKESDVEEDPAGVNHGEGGVLLAGMEGGHEAKEEADGKEEDAEGDSFVSPIDREKGYGEEEAEEGLRFVRVDGETMMGGVEHLGERDEVEEDGCNSGGDGDVAPSGAVVEGGGQDGERGYAVKKDRDSEPEEGHSNRSQAAKLANLQYIGNGERTWWAWGAGWPDLLED